MEETFVYGIATEHGQFYLYEYWPQPEPIKRFANALAVAKDHIDSRQPTKAAHIIVSVMYQQGGQYGLDTNFVPPTHSVPVVDLLDSTVTLYDRDMHLEKYTMSVAAFVGRYATVFQS